MQTSRLPAKMQLGRQVIDEARAQAHKAAKPLDLEVLTSNDQAIGFYEKMGFETIAQIQGPPGSGFEWVKEVVMRHSETMRYAPAAPGAEAGKQAFSPPAGLSPADSGPSPLKAA